MSTFINTVDTVGDAALTNSIIDRSISEFKDNIVSKINNGAFYGCESLKMVECPNVTFLNENSFYSCTVLESVKFEKAVAVQSYAFKNASNLKKVDFSSATLVGNYIFQNATALEALIFRNTDTLSTLYGSALLSSTIASGTGYIYVPSALVNSYKAATNWSTYANQFRALEDYTVDGTTTGELDETKI